MRRRRTAPQQATAGEAWLPRRETTVLLLSDSPALQGAVGRVSAAAAVELLVEADSGGLAGHWDGMSALLVDAALAVDESLAAGIAAWNGPTVVVALALEPGTMWRQAELLGADKVAVLPDSARWLANFLSLLRNPAQGAGVLGIVGGCGGAGASTLAVLLAAGAVRQGVRTLLVDGDPWGGGLCGALSARDVPGLRWPELLRSSGTINPEQLAASLPQLGGLALLSWGAEQKRTAVQGRGAVGEIVRAGRGAYGLVVVDLGRNPEGLRELAPHCNGILALAPARPHAISACVRLLEELPPRPTAAVVRDPLKEGSDAAMVASAMGLPLLGRMPQLRGAEQALQERRLTELLRKRAMRKLLSAALQWMSGDPADLPGTGWDGGARQKSAQHAGPSGGQGEESLGVGPSGVERRSKLGRGFT